MVQISPKLDNCTLVAAGKDSIFFASVRRLINTLHPSLASHHMLKYACINIMDVWTAPPDTKATI